jgi:hypothetical protein
VILEAGARAAPVTGTTPKPTPGRYGDKEMTMTTQNQNEAFNDTIPGAGGPVDPTAVPETGDLTEAQAEAIVEELIEEIEEGGDEDGNDEDDDEIDDEVSL